MTTATARSTDQSPGHAAARVFASIALAASILGAVMLTSQPADAQQVCLLHETAAKQLAEQHQETVVGRGLASNGKAMYEVFASEEGGWTLVVTNVEGRSCIIGSGVGWTDAAAPKGEPA